MYGWKLCEGIADRIDRALAEPRAASIPQAIIDRTRALVELSYWRGSGSGSSDLVAFQASVPSIAVRTLRKRDREENR